MKKFVLIVIFCPLLLSAQAPSDYYNSAENKKDASLKTALFNIIKNPDVTTYAGLWTAFYSSDTRPDDWKVWDMYSDIPDGTPPYIYEFQTDQCGNYNSENDCYNREHSFPKSWFGGEVSPMYRDLVHIYPTDGYVNAQRGNYPYGEVESANWTSQNGSKRGSGKSSMGYTDIVFEPIDAYKGDFARTYFYMVTCYEDRVVAWFNNAEAKPILAGNSYPAFKDWAVDLLLKWHRQDAVSPKEIDRNNVVMDVQGNRNPFIDYPELVEYIWGNQKGEIWRSNVGIAEANIAEIEIYPMPAKDFIVVKAENSQQSFDYEISTISSQIIKKGEANFNKQINITSLQNGMYWVKIIFEGKISVKKLIE
jgi:endonuclease I